MLKFCFVKPPGLVLESEEAEVAWPPKGGPMVVMEMLPCAEPCRDPMLPDSGPGPMLVMLWELTPPLEPIDGDAGANCERGDLRAPAGMLEVPSPANGPSPGFCLGAGLAPRFSAFGEGTGLKPREGALEPIGLPWVVGIADKPGPMVVKAGDGPSTVNPISFVLLSAEGCRPLFEEGECPLCKDGAGEASRPPPPRLLKLFWREPPMEGEAGPTPGMAGPMLVIGFLTDANAFAVPPYSSAISRLFICGEPTGELRGPNLDEPKPSPL